MHASLSRWSSPLRACMQVLGCVTMHACLPVPLIRALACVLVCARACAAKQALTEGSQDTMDLQQALSSGSTLEEALELAKGGRYVRVPRCMCALCMCALLCVSV